MGASQSALESFQDPGPAVTQERIVRAIKSYENTDKVDNVVVEKVAGSEKGEGFTSTLESVKVGAMVDGVNKSYAWVVKSMPRDSNRALMSLAYKADEREAIFYGDLLPQVRKFLCSKEMSDLMPMICSVPYSAWDKDDKVLIMEDLKVDGWRDAINKKAGLDIEHTRVAIRWLARFHAITYAFLEQYKGGVEQAKKDMPLFFWKYDDHFNFAQESAAFREMTNDSQRAIFKGLEEKNPGRNYSKYLEDLITEHLDMANAANKVKDSQDYKLLTLCHHDPWFNNMMFKYKDDGHVDEIILIDFQIPSYASPALDISFFLSSSTTGPLRTKYLPHILTLYHTVFADTVQRLGVSLDFSYEDLLEDFRKANLHGLSFALTALPTILAESKEDMFDPEEWMKALNEEDEEVKKKKLKEITDQQSNNYHSSDAIGERVRDLVDEWIDSGVFAHNI